MIAPLPQIRQQRRTLPMLFTGAMVLAMLREIEKPGSGKTETRRFEMTTRRGKVVESVWASLQPGDLIWVRESGIQSRCMTDHGWTGLFRHDVPRTWAEGDYWIEDRRGPGATYYAKTCRRESMLGNANSKVRPSVHMPKWANRLTLEVEAVRVEPLQEISFSAAQREGISMLSKDDGRTWKYGLPDRDGWPGTDDFGWPWHDWEPTPVRAYARLWDQINGVGAWAANPSVVAIRFKPQLINIEKLIGLAA